jgi:hypothetical protein
MPTEAPGNFNTAALFNATMGAVGAWQINPPRFKGYATSTQSIATGSSYVSVLLDTESLDSDGGHSTVTNTSRYTVQVAGLYHVIGTCGYGINATGNRAVQLAVNGASVISSQVIVPSAASNSLSIQSSQHLQLAVGDYVEVQTWQTSTISLATSVSLGLAPSMSVLWVSN